MPTPLRCHDEKDGVSNHQPHDCLLNRFFMIDICNFPNMINALNIRYFVCKISLESYVIIEINS